MWTLYEKLDACCETLLEEDFRYYNMALKCRLRQAEIAYLLTEDDFMQVHTGIEEKGMEDAEKAEHWEEKKKEIKEELTLDAREKAVFCFNHFQEIGQMELAHQANKLFERCSQKLAITQNNFFVFAQALSIRSRSYLEKDRKEKDQREKEFTYIQKQTNDFNEIVKNELEKTNM